MRPRAGETWESNGTSGADRVIVILEEIPDDKWNDELVTIAYLYHSDGPYEARIYTYPTSHVLKRYRRLA